MKKVTIKVDGGKQENDKAKRVYRAAIDTVRRLDDIVQQKRAYKDVFLPEAVNLRSRLQDYCERLLFYDPLEYGRKAEELLWRKVYYDVIQLMKHNRKQMRPSSSLESAFRTHLSAATGYYHHLIFKLQAEFDLRMEGISDFFHVCEPKAHRKPHQAKRGEIGPRVKDWAKRACHRCLIYLGDISRYQQDYDGPQSRAIAQRYYFQALSLCPEIGMAHNQLGTLAGTRYYNLDAIYYYLRCMTCPLPFEGASGNLNRLMDKNSKRYKDLIALHTKDLPPEQQRSKDMKRFIVRMLYLLDIFYFGKETLNAKALQDLCQSVLKDFNQCMFYQPPHVTNPTHPEEGHCHDDKLLPYIEDEMVFKLIVMFILTLHHMQEQSNEQVTTAQAFTLVLFSHILNHVVIRLQSALTELENPRKVLQVDSEDDKNTSTEADGGSPKNHRIKSEKDRKNTKFAAATTNASPEKNEDSEKPEKGKIEKEKTEKEKKRAKLSKLRRRRRRRRSSGSSSASNQSDLSEESDLSEGGEDDPIFDQGSDGEENAFLNALDSSGSDSDDGLMVSQELRPGFSIEPAPLVYQDSPDDPSMENLNSTLNKAFDNSNGQNFTADWLSSNNDLLQQTFASLYNQNINKTDGSDEITLAKKVSVPPGFEMSEESLAVDEITHKLENFVIETDTDTSNFPTDTENSIATTESEMDTETETDKETDKESVIDMSEVEVRRLERVLKIVSNESLLMSIKVYCDWLRTNPHIIAACAKFSNTLWSRLSVLLNFLPSETDLHKMELCRSEGVLRMVESATLQDWTPEQPLKEDLHLFRFSPLEDSKRELSDLQTKLDLTGQQEAILRICMLRKFGYFVAKMKSIKFSFDKEKGMFYGPLQIQSAAEEKDAQIKIANAEARRNQLMRDMAQLRLKEEVSQLEGSLQSHDQPNLPPYLVPDATVLCDNLSQVKHLVQSARFILIVPLAVVDHLDLLKKDNSGARDAIRWLETELRKGNRYVRAQKNHEKVQALPLKNLKKKDRDAWRFTQIVDCGKYLGQQSTNNDPAKGIFCILTNHNLSSTDISIRVKGVIEAARQEGIFVMGANEFYNNWKETWKTTKS